MNAIAPPANTSTRRRHKVLSDLVKTLESVKDDIEGFLDDPEAGPVLLEEAEEEDIFEELTSRNVEFCAWDDEGDVIAGKEPSLITLLSDDASEDPELFEAVARLRRGDLFEALIHLERAIPAFSGLHDAVRKLQR